MSFTSEVIKQGAVPKDCPLKLDTLTNAETLVSGMQEVAYQNLLPPLQSIEAVISGLHLKCCQKLQDEVTTLEGELYALQTLVQDDLLTRLAPIYTKTNEFVSTATTQGYIPNGPREYYPFHVDTDFPSFISRGDSVINQATYQVDSPINISERTLPDQSSSSIGPSDTDNNNAGISSYYDHILNNSSLQTGLTPSLQSPLWFYRNTTPTGESEILASQGPMPQPSTQSHIFGPFFNHNDARQFINNYAMFATESELGDEINLRQPADQAQRDTNGQTTNRVENSQRLIGNLGNVSERVERSSSSQSGIVGDHIGPTLDENETTKNDRIGSSCSEELVSSQQYLEWLLSDKGVETAEALLKGIGLDKLVDLKKASRTNLLEDLYTRIVQDREQ